MNPEPLSDFSTSGGPCSRNSHCKASIVVSAVSSRTGSQASWQPLARSRTARRYGQRPSMAGSGSGMVHGPYRSRVVPMQNVDHPLVVQFPEVAEAIAEVFSLAAGQIREGGLHGGRADARPHAAHEIDGLVASLRWAAMTRTAQDAAPPGNPHASDVPRRPSVPGAKPSCSGRQRPAEPLAAWPSGRSPRHAGGRRARLRAGAAGQASRVSESWQAQGFMDGGGSCFVAIVCGAASARASRFFPRLRWPGSMVWGLANRGSCSANSRRTSAALNSTCKRRFSRFQFRDPQVLRRGCSGGRPRGRGSRRSSAVWSTSLRTRWNIDSLNSQLFTDFGNAPLAGERFQDGFQAASWRAPSPPGVPTDSCRSVCVLVGSWFFSSVNQDLAGRARPSRFRRCQGTTRDTPLYHVGRRRRCKRGLGSRRRRIGRSFVSRLGEACKAAAAFKARATGRRFRFALPAIGVSRLGSGLATGLGCGLRGRLRRGGQADRPLRGPHQRLLPGTVLPQAGDFLLQHRHLVPLAGPPGPRAAVRRPAPGPPRPAAPRGNNAAPTGSGLWLPPLASARRPGPPGSPPPCAARRG